MQRSELEALYEDLVQRWNQFEQCTILEVSIDSARVREEQVKIIDYFKTWAIRLKQILDEVHKEPTKPILLADLIPVSELENAIEALKHVVINIKRRLSDECKNKMTAINRFLLSILSQIYSL